MSLFVKKAGIFTTIQDLGRTGYRHLGINPGGAMDKTAVRLINTLLGNAENEAVVEMHFPAPEFQFMENAFFALGGAEFDAFLDDKSIENWTICFAPKNSNLRFAAKSRGNRAYLSVKGGLTVKKWLNSCSTNLIAGAGGIDGRRLLKGDEIGFKSNTSRPNKLYGGGISSALIPGYTSSPSISVFAGAEFEMLTASSQKRFLNQRFTITNESNRMGFRLFGQSLFPHYNKQIVSSAVDYGTIQLLPDGNLVILMVDHQTTGGYPRIAHVIERDLSVLAQLGANDSIKFDIVTFNQAEDLTLNFERQFNLFHIGCSYL